MSESTGSRTRRRGPLLAVAAWILAAAYLGGWSLLVPFLLMVGGLMLPTAALSADVLRGSGLSDEMRVCAGGLVAFLLLIPVYFLRRALPLPPVLLDGLIAVATLGAALATGALRRYLRAAASPAFRGAGWLLAGVVPGVACLVWLGFEVSRGSGVRYYGLFNIDFANLAGVAAMIKTSSGVPAWVTAGGGALHYHWWFFTLAAWLSEFAGANGRVASALALSNLLAAVLLAATIVAAVADHLRARGATASEAEENARARVAAAAAGVVVVAPFSVYAYQFIVGHAHLSWFTLGDRNSLLLSVVNSMSTFGNNTLALAAALLVGVALAAYRARPSWRSATVAAVAGVSVLGLSVTLAIPIILAAAAWILIARVRQLGRLAAAAVVVGGVGLLLLRATNVLGGASQHFVLSFDNGQFIQNVAFGMAPIWLLAAAAIGRRQLSFWWLLVVAGVLVPSLLNLTGHTVMSSTMSMKIGSLLPVAAAPLVANGLCALLPKWARGGVAAEVPVAAGAPTGRRVVWRAIAALALAVGLTNTLAYALQFAFYRLAGRDAGRFAELPADYVQALTFVRKHTPRGTVVVDPNGDLLRDTIGTLLIAERQVWLPTHYSAELVHTDVDNPEIMSRLELWRAWEGRRFTDEAMAATIADRADVLIGPPEIQAAAWEQRYASGAYAVYQSRRRPGR